MLLDFHLFFIWTTLAVVLVADEQGFLWLSGRKRHLNERLLEWLHLLTGLGLAGLITTGGLMIVYQYTFFLDDPVFVVKLLFVGALIINGFVISAVNKIATHRAWSELSRAQQFPLLVSGGISMASWAGAVICGLLL